MFGYYEDLPAIAPEIGNIELFTTIMVVYLVIILLSFAYSVLVYVLQSLGMYTIANRRGIHNPWLAWLPIANMWTLGSISDQYQYVAKGKVRNRRKVLLGLNIAVIVLAIPFFISYVFFMASLFEMMMAGEPEIMDMIGPMLAMLGFCLIVLVVTIIQTVFMYIAYYDLFVSCKPDSAVLFLVLTILLGFVLPYFVFACRKKDLGMPPRKPRTPVQQVQLENPVVLPGEPEVTEEEPDTAANEPEVAKESEEE